MPRVQWAHRYGRPCVEVVLTVAGSNQPFPRILLADTGAGPRPAPFQLVLDESDCLVCNGKPATAVSLAGAYQGLFPMYTLLIRLPALGFSQWLFAVGVPTVPEGFDGIACFDFLNRFTYGNFGDSNRFGLES